MARRPVDPPCFFGRLIFPSFKSREAGGGRSSRLDSLPTRRALPAGGASRRRARAFISLAGCSGRGRGRIAEGTRIASPCSAWPRTTPQRQTHALVHYPPSAPPPPLARGLASPCGSCPCARPGAHERLQHAGPLYRVLQCRRHQVVRAGAAAAAAAAACEVSAAPKPDRELSVRTHDTAGRSGGWRGAAPGARRPCGVSSRHTGRVPLDRRRGSEQCINRCRHRKACTRRPAQ